MGGNDRAGRNNGGGGVDGSLEAVCVIDGIERHVTTYCLFFLPTKPCNITIAPCSIFHEAWRCNKILLQVDPD